MKSCSYYSSTQSRELLPILAVLLVSTSVVARSQLHHGGDVQMDPQPFLRRGRLGIYSLPARQNHSRGNSLFHSDPNSVRATSTSANTHRKLLKKTLEEPEVEDELSEFLLRILDEEVGSMDLSKPADSDGSTADANVSTSSPIPNIDGLTAYASTSSPSTTDNNDGNQTVKSKQPPWPHERSDIPLDPSITYGELENGMRYIIMPNSEPPGRLAIRLHVDAGANMELDNERGMAHFLEHMMFAGTETFPPETLLPTFQLLGVALGNHVNAYTNFIETVYKLGLPSTDNKTLTPSFAWMRDILGGALILEEEVERERGVVISEIELLDSAEDRLSEDALKWQIPDHLISQRFVRGTEESIRGLTRQMFTDFYTQYYVPRRATLTVVGDMSTTDIKAWIDTLDSVPDSGNRGSDPDYGTVPKDQGLQSKVFVDNQVGELELVIERVRSIEMAPDTEAERFEEIQLFVANSIVSRRIQKLLQNDDNTIIWGGASTDNWYNIVEFGYVWAQPRKGFWRESVAALEQELRRAQLFGFAQSEIDDGASNRLSYYEQQVLSKNTRQTSSLADTINDSIKGGVVFSTPEEDLRIATIALESLTTDLVHETFRTYWNTTDIYIYLKTNEIDVAAEDAAEELKDLYLKSQLVEVTPPAEEEAAVFAYTYFGPPGTVVSDTLIEDLEIRQLILSNNIRINMKQTKFEADNIRILARFGTGKLGQPKERTYLDAFTQYMISLGGLGQQTWSELESLMAGKNVEVAFSIEEGHFDISGGSTTENLLLGLQIMAAHFADPAFGEEAVRKWNDEIPSFLNFINNSLDGTYFFDVYGWLLGGDERFTAPTEEELLAFIADDARDWLVPSLNSSYLEISLVGDLNQDETIIFLLQTFGALPERADSPLDITAQNRLIATPAAPQSMSFTYESRLPQAAAVVVWEIPSFVEENIEENRKFNVLSSIFADRMRVTIREELGGAYAPEAWFTMSDAFDYGFFVAYVDGLPDELPIFADSILSIAENITTGLISEDEYLRAVRTFQTEVSDSLRRNNYWLYNVMAQCQKQPVRLEWSRSRSAFYESLTVDEMNVLAQQYLTQDGAWSLSLLPVNGTRSEAE